MTAGAPAGSILQHASVVEIDGRGVLIRGPSGAGKTALAIELLFRCRASEIASALVADDQAFLSADDDTGALLAAVPGTIAGLIELRGFGVAPVAASRCKAETRLALCVTLVPAEDSERVADPDRRARLHTVELPELVLPRRQPVCGAYAVLGWLGLSRRLL